MQQLDARDTLKQILTTYGRATYQEPGRLEGLLKDLCGDRRREITLIMGALRENVPADLLSTSATATPRELLFERLQGRLEENLSLTADAARWAVETWALALDQVPPGYKTPSPGYRPGNSDRPLMPSGPTPLSTPPPVPPGPGWAPVAPPPVGGQTSGPVVQGYPPPSPSPLPVVVADKASSRATTALILALVGLLCGLLTGIPAAIMGAAEMRDIREGRASPAGKGTAQAALIIGIIVSVGSILYLIAVAITAATSNH